MAIPRCPKCDSTTFEMQELPKIKNANFRHQVLNCTSCGAIVGTFELFNVNFRLNKLAEKLNIDLDR
jgi:uncharacterized Zn finger protein